MNKTLLRDTLLQAKAVLADRWPALAGLWIVLEMPGQLYTYFGNSAGLPDISTFATTVVYDIMQDMLATQSFLGTYAYSITSNTLYYVLYTLAFGSLLAIFIGATVAIVSYQRIGDRLDVRDAVEIGFRTVLQVWGVVLVLESITVLAEYFLLIPGIWLGMLWAVSASAAAQEKLHFRSAANRSAQLTRNHRWKICGVMIVIWLLYVLVGLAHSLAIEAVDAEFYQNNFQAFQFIAEVAYRLVGFFNTVFLVCMYFQLCEREAGADEGSIAFTFS